VEKLEPNAELDANIIGVATCDAEAPRSSRAGRRRAPVTRLAADSRIKQVSSSACSFLKEPFGEHDLDYLRHGLEP
jgi:hypothetical protein